MLSAGAVALGEGPPQLNDLLTNITPYKNNNMASTIASLCQQLK